MSDLCVYDIEDTNWDEICLGDDHIVPHPCSERAGAPSIVGNISKKPQRGVTSITSNAQNTSAASELSSTFRSAILEKDSFSHSPNVLLSSSADIELFNATSCLASNSTDDIIMSDKAKTVGSNSLNFPLGDVTHSSNNINFFENTEDKNSNDFLYYGWPEIENFDDVDRMFRSCDSTFGLGDSKVDEIGWFSSADNIGDPEDAQKSDISFSNPESKAAENYSENRDSLKCFSSSDSAMTNCRTDDQDGNGASLKSDPYVAHSVRADSKDGSILKEQISDHNKQFKLQNQSMGETRKKYFGNGNFSCISSLSSEDMQLSSGATSHQQQQARGLENGYLQNPPSYVHSVNSQFSETTLIHPTPSAVKSELNGLAALSPRESSYSSSHLTALARSEKQFQISRENHTDVEVGSRHGPLETDSPNFQDGSAVSSGPSDISLEAASFRQLQRVTEQLDLKTKLCIRDSLYRLAWSAEQRHKLGDNGAALMAEGTNSFNSLMDVERDTNPIDRSIAHLLFHRPSESSSSIQLKAPIKVNEPVAMVEDMVIPEEAA